MLKQICIKYAFIRSIAKFNRINSICLLTLYN